MNRALFSIFAVLCLVYAQAIKIDLLHGEVKPRMLAHSASEEEKGDGLSRGLRNLENNQYYSYVGFGKDSQGNINWRPVVYDTGSSWLWTSKDDCKCTNVGGKTLNPDDISSWKSSGKEIKLEYGSGNLIGDLGTLHTYFSETEYVTNQYALLATQATMVGGPTSGIFGLSQKAGSDNYPTMIYNLKDQGKISKLMFTVALRPNTTKANEGSYIKLGEASTDEVLEGQDFYYVPLVNSGLYDNYYSFEVGRIAIGDDVYVNKNVGVADTGTSLLALPVPFLESLLEKYGGSKSCARTNVGLYGCKCTGASQIDDMTVQVGTHEWTIPSEKFVIAEDGYCIFLIQPSPIEELMILGDIFLRNVVAVFDIENEQIGFASNVSQVAPTLKPVVTSSGMSGVQSSVLEEVNHKGENRNEDEIDPQLFLPM